MYSKINISCLDFMDGAIVLDGIDGGDNEISFTASSSGG